MLNFQKRNKIVAGINKAAIIILTLFLCSCGIYKYRYKSEGMMIVSQKGNPITGVSIKSEKGDYVAHFEPIESKSSKIFSLKDFSPEYFKCSDGCPFKFEPGKIYYISVSPKGDRMLSPIKIKVESDGRIIKL